MRTITKLSATNFLSLRSLDIELGELTVLVGPNGAGKSNVLNVFKFIGDIARSDLAPAIDSFGGFSQLMFRGDLKKTRNFRQSSIVIKLEGVITQYSTLNSADTYQLDFHERALKKVGEDDATARLIVRAEELFFKRTKGRGRRITVRGGEVNIIELQKEEGKTARRPAVKELSLQVKQNSSGLAILRRLGKDYEAPQVEEIASVFQDLRLFDVNVSAARLPSTLEDAKNLRSDASNLAAFLDWMRQFHPERFELLEEDIRLVLPGFEGFSFVGVGGAQEGIRLEINEKNLKGATPLSRASFGTIRSIALFAMLHDPNPPKLTCLEEVDHGLHPHALERLVERLRTASKRTQILVATHSPALVNRLSADELVILERDPNNGATVRPDITSAQIKEMEQKTEFGLGELWFSGVLGG
jgi:predicted ATPase